MRRIMLIVGLALMAGAATLLGGDAVAPQGTAGVSFSRVVTPTVLFCIRARWRRAT
jgi:hypothetical protein